MFGEHDTTAAPRSERAVALISSDIKEIVFYVVFGVFVHR